MTQFELLDSLDKGVQQSSMEKSFLTLNYLQCGTGLLGITILVAQFPQLYSLKIPNGISRKFFLIKNPNLYQFYFLKNCYIRICVQCGKKVIIIVGSTFDKLCLLNLQGTFQETHFCKGRHQQN